MGKLSTAVDILSHNPAKLVFPLEQRGMLRFIPDSLCLKLLYKASTGKKLDLDYPELFCEKLQWLKLHDRRPEYVTMVDKYEVRRVIERVLGPEYLIPLIGAYDTPEEIPWDELPDRFVVKCNHGSHMNLICKDKSRFDTVESEKKLRQWLKRNPFWGGREWPYENVAPKVIIEEYMDDGSPGGELTDYKWYCFGGDPKYCQVIADRQVLETIDFYDCQWQHMPFNGLNSCPFAAEPLPPPPHLQQMVEISRLLAKDTHFVRIDLYEIGGKVYSGEFTLYPLNGFGSFTPGEWNRTIGNYLKLPKAEG